MKTERAQISGDWKDDCVVLVTLTTDWAKGYGTAKPNLAKLRRGRVLQDKNLLTDTAENRLELAYNARHSTIAVYRLSDIDLNKGNATELYRITRDDYSAYLTHADEMDARS